MDTLKLTTFDADQPAALTESVKEICADRLVLYAEWRARPQMLELVGKIVPESVAVSISIDQDTLRAAMREALDKAMVVRIVP